ncbi:MAG: SUMF1/EgtB/PvdO family nonheme iron enzyme [Candidatus Schekmanbacteria bacterium]|nr:SUMF1/EgtB/PvdO family nonheme iron enzyme [Candidatus Schekmanbacteria bacterium]
MPKKLLIQGILSWILLCLISRAGISSAGMGGMGSFGGEAEKTEPKKEKEAAKLQDVLWNKETDGIVRIFVSPASELYVDGELQKDPNNKQRFSEKYVAAMKTGKHTVKLAREGFDPEQREIEVEAGQPYSMNFTLMKSGQKTGGMVLIPAGEFTMGLNPGDTKWIIQKIGGEERFFRNQLPTQKITLPTYYLDKYEVTNAQYKKFVDATGHKPPEHWEDGKIPAGLESHPVVSVTWHDAAAYAKWAGKRLPTEAEWEKAARGSGAYLYPWGDTFQRNILNSANGGPGTTTPVGKYEKGRGEYGTYDMAGNVKEWTADNFKDYPGNPFKDVFYGLTEPKVARGGSFTDPEYDCMGSTRFKFSPDSSYEDVGFRCAKDTGGRTDREIPD